MKKEPTPRRFWIFLLAFSILGCVAWAQDAESPETAKVATLAVGVGLAGGAWRGALVGLSRALVGVGKGAVALKDWDWGRVIVSCIVGAVAGALTGAGVNGMDYDSAVSLLASYGAVEVLHAVLRGAKVWWSKARGVKTP